MGAANGDGHPPDSHRKRIASERAEVQRLDGHALIEAEVAEAASLSASKLQSIAEMRARMPSLS